MAPRDNDSHKGATRAPPRDSGSAQSGPNRSRAPDGQGRDPDPTVPRTASHDPPNFATYNQTTYRQTPQNYAPTGQPSRLDNRQTTVVPSYRPYPENPGPFASRTSTAAPAILPGTSDASRRHDTRYNNGSTQRPTDYNEEMGANRPVQTINITARRSNDQQSVDRVRTGRESAHTLDSTLGQQGSARPLPPHEPTSRAAMTTNTSWSGGQQADDSLEPMRPPTTIRRGSNLVPPDRSSNEILARTSSSTATTATTGSQSVLPTRPREPASTAQFAHLLPSDLRDFAGLPRNELRNVATYALRNPGVLSADHQLFLDEAARAYASGKKGYGDSLVQQSVIIRRLQRKSSNGRRSEPKDYFARLLDEGSRTREEHFRDFDEAQRDAREKSKSVSTEQQPLSRGPGSRDRDDLGMAAEYKHSRAQSKPQQKDLSQNSTRTDTTRRVAFQGFPSNPADSMMGRDPRFFNSGDITGQSTPGTTRRYSHIQNPSDQAMVPQSNPQYDTLGTPTSRMAAENHQPVPLSTATSAASLPTAAGKPQSTVTPQDTEPPSDKLDSRFFLRSSAFYRVGRVFAVLWHESLSETAQAQDNSRYTYTSNPVSIGRFGESIYTTVRRMVVVREGKGFCVCIQINTYSGRGLIKFKNSPEDVQAHSIIHMSDTRPIWLRDEPKSIKKHIAVRKAQEEHHLGPASRLCYARPHTVEHTVKSMNIGRIEEGCLHDVLNYYAEINNIL